MSRPTPFLLRCCLAGALAAALAMSTVDGQTAKGAPATLDLRAQAPIRGDAEAGKAQAKVCSACHGERGVGIAPTFPNLAGQSATYLYVQLKTFRGGERKDPVMGPLVAALGDADMRNLAAYYASLPARPGGHGAPGSRGARLFAEGDPAKGIPPCQGCHGPAGRGPRSDSEVSAKPRPPWAAIPRLQGQSGAYVAKALNDFRSGARGATTNAAIMRGVARPLADADVQALADYLGAD
jgi:cytochrome c553